VRAEAINPNLLLEAYLTFFYLLSAIAEDITLYIRTDTKKGPSRYEDWYSTVKETFTRKARKAAAIEVDKTWLNWKFNKLNKLTAIFKKKIAAKVKKKR
jgi:hypothetical protein